MAIQRVTGTQDVLPDDRRYWDWIVAEATSLARTFGFERLDVPVIEYTDLYARGAGEASDFFVQKEMFTILEEDGRHISLRPEFTAGFVRAYIQNGLAQQPQPVKLYTIGPAFRRERPQAGRFRQHSQFNAEILGSDDPVADVEMMSLALHLYGRLGYGRLALNINSTGCPECRPAYIATLRTHLEGHAARLAPVDQQRLALNPLRVLDSKEEGMESILAAAPHIIDHLCQDCAEHFADVRRLLDGLDHTYAINHRLVRGIDYYTKTVFEIWDDHIGAQGAVGGGGRYDGLAEAIGGNATPGVGFGLGIERIILGLKARNVAPPQTPPNLVMFVHFGGETKDAAVVQADRLRAAGVGAIVAFARGRRSVKSQLREANKRPVSHVVILGEEELANGEAAVRRLEDGSQTAVPLAQLASWLA